MSAETNKETVRRFIEEVVNQNPSQARMSSLPRTT